MSVAGGLPSAQLTSSLVYFPSLLCTRHAPCEPFLRGIRTKGSWEYLSGTGESRERCGRDSSTQVSLPARPVPALAKGEVSGLLPQGLCARHLHRRDH